MAQSGFTPIITYHSTTPSAVPTAGNLAPGELALNIADMKLYAENSSGVVTLLADANAGGVTSVDVSGGTTGLTTSGGPITTSGTITLGGTLAVANGGTGITSFGTGVATALGTNVGSAGAFVTFDGALGTPSSGTLTNATGLPVSTGISGLGTNVATALAVNVGSAGAFVTFDGALGTPSSGTLTNATGLPIATGVSGLGSNVATFLATPSSANFASAVTDETGSGALVFGTGPTIGTAALNRSLLNTTKEVITVSATAASSTVNFDAITQSVLYYTTDASGNWTLNVRGDGSTTLDSIMSTGESITVAFLATQGGTAYYQSAFQVDGSSVTPKWQGGSAPTEGNASGIDAYVINIIKTGSATFTALASITQFA